MTISLNLEHIWLALEIWCLICATLVALIFPYGNLLQQLKFFIIALTLGPTVPVVAVIVLPLVLKAIWEKHVIQAQNL